ncbi:hypothetical protein CRUP_035221 [Coryphaenoides rupestris]|nr:hypothetical protein CRUP_035221 [Coryphaenoides rupestris]
MERASKEMEVLRRQQEAASQELKEALQEAEVAKCRRDWAFQERDKIVAERESIRTLCDNLRRERDRAVSDLADALRNLDDMRKQKNDAWRELKDVKVNDWLLKINDLDLTNKDRKQAVKAVLSGGGVVNMVVRRRKSLGGGRTVTPVHLNLTGHKVQCHPGSKDLINGIALDNKSLTECEALLRNGRDSLSLSLMKFFSHSTSGQNIFESLRDASEKSNGRAHPSEVHARNGRNLKHNSSTQTDIFLYSEHPSSSSTTATTSLGSLGGDRLRGRGRGAEEAEPAVYGDARKPFSMGSLHAMSLRPAAELGVAGRYSGPSAFQECCPYAKGPASMSYDPGAAPDCVAAETGSEKKHSGGTWPKVVAGVGGGASTVATPTPGSVATPTQLSIYKSPKQRKSIFDPDTFKRPETPSSSSAASAKLEYMAANQMAANQMAANQMAAIASATTPTPPTPPARTDSFKFKHKHQSSSASDCTVTSDGSVSVATGESSAVAGPGPGPGRERGGRERDRNGNHYFLDGKVLTSRKSCDEDIGRTRGGEEPEVKRPRPKSAPALRRRMTPQPIALPSFQSYSQEDAASEPRELRPQHHGRLSLDLSSQQKRGGGGGDYVVEAGQSQGSISTLPRISVSPQPMGERRKDSTVLVSHQRRLLGNWSCVVVDSSGCSATVLLSQEPQALPGRARRWWCTKGAEPLGISIVSGENGGIFVSKVTGGSIAHQAGLEYGDQLLEYNPHMYQLGVHSRSSSRLEPVGGAGPATPTPGGGTPPVPDLPHPPAVVMAVAAAAVDTLSEQDEGTLTPSTQKTSPTLSPSSCVRMPCDSGGGRKSSGVGEPRLVTVRRPGVEVGVTLCGGNLRGVYVESLEEDSPARGPDGLQPGDLILEYNSVSMRTRTAEEVYVEMLKPAETVTLRRPRASCCLVRSGRGCDVMGSKYEGIGGVTDTYVEAAGDLSFQRDDILYVDESLPRGTFGSWMAWQLDEKGQQMQRGQIPSKMDQEFHRRASVTELKEDAGGGGGGGKSLSAAARRSFFRRKQKHKRSGSRDGKEAASVLDAVSTDSLPLLDEVMKASQQAIERGVKELPLHRLQARRRAF